ncbi:hypothetical protein ABPG74_006370 [Tetrahymena malaccensis]
MRFILTLIIGLIMIKQNTCSGIVKLNLQKVVPLKSGYFNKLSFTSDQFWDSDSSHTMSQDGELKLQLLYPYDSSRFDSFIFEQESDFQMYYSNVKDIKNQRSCVENSPLNFTSNQILLRKNNITFNISDLDKQIVVIDNTKYPCNNGSYYPLIQLYYEYTVTFNFQYSYYYACKSVILVGVLVSLIFISGIIICYFRSRKLRKKLLKKQFEESQLLEQKDLLNEMNNFNNDNITSEFQSDKSVVNSLASFSAGFQKSYHQKSFFQNSLQQSQNLNSRAANTQSGKSLGQQSQYSSMDDNSIANKLSKNVDSRRDTGNNRSVYDDKKSQENSFNLYNETSFNSEQQFSFVDKLSPKQFNSNNSLPKTSNSFIKNNNTVNYYQNEELHKIQEEDAIPGSPQLRFKKK